MMKIVGGTYHEKCFEPQWDEIYGSGLRACRAVLALDKECQIQFHTFVEEDLVQYLDSYAEVYPSFAYFHNSIPKTITFSYDHPLIDPRVYPRMDVVKTARNEIFVKGEHVLLYGFIEGSARVEGTKIVYDPQSPVNPVAFSETKSQAEKLAMVVNWAEAIKLAKTNDLETVKRFFFNSENAEILVLKMGAKGALVVNRRGKELLVPVYMTNKVWSIGSGDVFAAVFSYYWFNDNDEFTAAQKASYATAEYCDHHDYQFSPFESNPNIHPLILSATPKGQIYLAGPFFTFAQRWLVDQIRQAFLDMGVSVFSPLHDVGYGGANDIVSKDLAALERSSLVFAILDGLDSGTLFETGYAISKGIPMIGYVQNEKRDSLVMLEGSSCDFESDFTTAIYKAYWKLAKYE